MTELTSSKSDIYLDSGSFARPSSAAVDALVQVSGQGWADPHQVHHQGRHARALLEGSREAISAHLGVTPAVVRFAPNFSMATSHAIGGLLAARRRVGTRAVHLAVEKAVVINGLEFHASERLDVGVDQSGLPDADGWRHAVSAPGVGVAVAQQANQETGVIQPLADLYAAAQAAQVPLIVDGSTSFPRCDPGEHWDALVVDSAVWGAPVPVGIVVTRPQTRWRAVWPEDSDAWFPGGTSIPAVVASAVALDEFVAERSAMSQHHEHFLEQISAAIVRDFSAELSLVHRAEIDALNHLLTIVSARIDGETLAIQLDREGVSVGAGSACSASALETSHVLKAMGVAGAGSIRIGLDAASTQSDVDGFLAALPRALERVRHLFGGAV